MPIRKIISYLSIALTVTAAVPAPAFAFKLQAEPKIAMVLLSSKDDGGWSQSFDESRLRMEHDMHRKIYALYNMQDDQNLLQSTIDDLINRGYNVIIGAGSGYSGTFKALADRHPDVAFLNAAGSTNAANLESFYPRTYESQYLCGMAAAAVSRSGKLGYVATAPSGMVHWAISAYELGAREINPDAELAVIYTGARPDDAKVRAATLALIREGAEVIGDLVGSPTPQIVAQENGVFATGHYHDLREFAPTATQCSSVSAWDRFLEPEIEKIVEGTWQPGANGAFFSIKDGVADVVCCGSAVPQAAVDKIMAARQAMIDGKRQVWAGPLSDQDGKERVADGQGLSDADLRTMDWYVAGVTDHAADQNLASGR
jgi:basic membrane lipoprotein Med (substrate-binding protein (PBP1-ABC) superfamily)